MRSGRATNIMNLLIGMVLAAVMSLAIPLLLSGGRSGMTVESFFQDYISNLMMGFFIATWVPSPVWGIVMAKKAQVRSEMGLHLIQTAVVTVVMVLLMTVGQLFLKIGACMELVMLFKQIVLPIIVLIYPILLVITPLAGKLTDMICTSDAA